ncbi:MAG: DUF4290 domain-containing protein [Bacteroidales bacterium]|jgi:hypothetical protein|nr:DUF4290 domain-containing protein [Bacteroidales bacterium]MBQ3983325.1 DUF4290 domain-containing protein [Bacteroidales bacterium]
MEYNTQREKLKITDYGRNIYKLIEYTKHVEERDKRNLMASIIVDIMSQISSESKDVKDYKRKYWVHLMILSKWELDIDLPYDDITPEETVEFAPHPISYTQSKVTYRHYGSIMESMIKKVAEYPEGEERDELVRLMAHAMKRDYLLWNRDTVEDDLISMQLEKISGDRLQVPEDFHYLDYREYLKGTDDERRPNGTRKKKKKKKN